MNKITMLALANTLLLAGSIHASIAAPVQVNITGNVIASPCTVDTANSNLDVTLGDIPATELATAGSYGGTAQTFTIALKDCPASTTKTVATISGTPYASDTNLFANTGTAAGVGVKIKPNAAAWTDTSVNPNQSTWVQNVNATTHAVSYVFDARSYTSVGSINPGTIVSAMQVAFTYQ